MASLVSQAICHTLPTESHSTGAAEKAIEGLANMMHSLGCISTSALGSSLRVMQPSPWHPRNTVAHQESPPMLSIPPAQM